jgi:hypothetical protein
MNRSFQNRLVRAAHGIARLPQRAYTDAENRQWAERIIAEIMEEHNLSREEALGVVREYAPTVAEWLRQEAGQ